MTLSKGEIIARQVPEAATSVLDIGFAQHDNQYLLRPGRKVYGVDMMESHPEGYEKVFVCDLNVDRLPFDDGELDAATMGCTLAHVAHPLRLLAEINRVLKPNGTLVITSPNPNYYWETVLNIFYHRFKNRVAKSKHEEHFYSFSRYTMRTSLWRAGFKVEREVGVTLAIVKTSFVFHPLRFPGLAYEIVYVCRKDKEPQSYTTVELVSGHEQKIPTTLFN